VRVRGRTLTTATTSPDGQLDAVVLLPADLAPGRTPLSVEDVGSGRVLEAELEIGDPRRPGVVLQPARASAGDAIAVSAGGLPTGIEAVVLLEPAGSRQLLREGRTTRDGVLLLVVLLPPDLQAGDYAVAVERPAGTALAPPAALEVRP
jgi:hypothetical protein